MKVLLISAQFFFRSRPSETCNTCCTYAHMEKPKSCSIGAPIIHVSTLAPTMSWAEGWTDRKKKVFYNLLRTRPQTKRKEKKITTKAKH